MRTRWVGAVLVATATPIAFAAGDAAPFEPVPTECSAFGARLATAVAPAAPYPLAVQALLATLEPECRQAIDRGSWGSLAPALAEPAPPLESELKSSMARERRRTALCAITPPGAAAVVEPWFSSPEPLAAAHARGPHRAPADARRGNAVASRLNRNRVRRGGIPPHRELSQ